MLEWTGERFVSGVKGDVEMEHLHRYHAAAELVAGLDVLDLAGGEGYGSAILARRAKSVARFEVGRSDATHLADRSIDAIACFETIAHVQQHWIHDAFVLQSHWASVAGGLVGIPMRKIELSVIRPNHTLPEA